MLTIKEAFKRVDKKNKNCLFFPLKENKQRLSAAATVYPPNGFSEADQAAPSRKKFPFSGDINAGIMAEAWALLVVAEDEEVGGGGWISFPTWQEGGEKAEEPSWANKRSGETGETAIH